MTEGHAFWSLLHAVTIGLRLDTGDTDDGTGGTDAGTGNTDAGTGTGASAGTGPDWGSGSGSLPTDDLSTWLRMMRFFIP